MGLMSNIFNNFKKEDKTESAQISNESEQKSPISKEKVRKVLEGIKKETEVPTMKFVLNNEKKPSVFDSKVGGIGYATHGVDFPKDSKGRELRLLAQINCSDVELKEYPKTGILQFWVLDDDVVGMNFDNNTLQDTFRVVYYTDVDKSVTEDEIKAKSKPYMDDDSYFPVSGEFKLEFEKTTDSLSAVSSSDYYDGEKLFIDKFNEMFPEDKLDCIDSLGVDLDEVDDEIYNQNFGHKIGGYPGFTQWDPRDAEDSHNFLLFQLDSDYEGDGNDNVIWGDSGICNFFINSEKLKQLDFSDVIYNWDCY